MIEVIFTHNSDALKLQKYLDKHCFRSWFHETSVQNKTQFHLSIEVSSCPDERDKVLEGFTQFIVNEKCIEWSEEIVRNNFFYEDVHEIHQILEIVSEIRAGERNELLQLVGEWDEPRFIHESLALVMNGHSTISFDSFSKFRLKKVQEKLIRIVELGIDEYKMEQEYQMFIHMLRVYLASKDKKINTIHLYSTQNGFRFFNEEMKEISRNELLAVIDKRLLTNHPLYVDSHTIAPLLSLSPK